MLSTACPQPATACAKPGAPARAGAIRILRRKGRVGSMPGREKRGPDAACRLLSILAAPPDGPRRFPQTLIWVSEINQTKTTKIVAADLRRHREVATSVL